jgi:hypothetical protein
VKSPAGRKEADNIRRAGCCAQHGWQQPVGVLFLNQLLSHRMAGTVIAKARADTRSMEAASDSTAL